LVVAIVSADPKLRVHAAGVLAGAGYEVAFSAPDGEQAAESLASHTPDAVVVIDPAPRHAASEQIRAFRSQLGEEAIVAVVGADHRRGAIRAALGVGARAFIALERIDDALAPSLVAALAGQLVMPADRPPQLHSQVLTSREKQVLALVVMGMTNAEIAAKMYLAESTVKSHLSSAFNKLGVSSRNEAAAAILDPESGVGMGILTIPSDDGAPSA
jgi:DNA-binding NarL/FixJ family response regulator